MNVARSTNDIQANLEFARSVGNESGLVAYWQFEQWSARRPANTGHGNDGLLYGPTWTYLDGSLRSMDRHLADHQPHYHVSLCSRAARNPQAVATTAWFSGGDDKLRKHHVRDQRGQWNQHGASFDQHRRPGVLPDLPFCAVANNSYGVVYGAIKACGSARPWSRPCPPPTLRPMRPRSMARHPQRAPPGVVPVGREHELWQQHATRCASEQRRSVDGDESSATPLVGLHLSLPPRGHQQFWHGHGRRLDLHRSRFW